MSSADSFGLLDCRKPALEIPLESVSLVPVRSPRGLQWTRHVSFASAGPRPWSFGSRARPFLKRFIPLLNCSFLTGFGRGD